ncbi:polysaccharide export protein [Vreelandella subglaciescola]|uniref:Polysaccharide export outer membrane protein n=1 Tax=Vreelandella subglaciescola TaxID=29571 RepID=A0A1M7HC01_9GAMM|nr:polysaccharide export protein [Halomonas subglaciescola]SHM26091.1 polysaccharide export outer membrane protein [Halomonas subglaciescola]
MRHSTPIKFLATLGGVLWLSGCALAPGGHIDHRSEAAPIDDLVDIEPITPGLLATYRQTRQEGRATAAPAALSQALEEYEYRIGEGDVLSITVYDHPELTIPAGAERSAAEAGNQVRNDGSIFYPYVGRLEVVGLTLEEMRRLLTRRLANYIQQPQIDVGVAAYRAKKVYISGAVSEPGALPITSVPLTVTEAISQAGGADADANWHKVFLTRNGKEEQLSLYALLREGDRRQERLLRDGDVLHVPTAENQAVAVMGQVASPGNIPVGNERLTLTDAISRSGGIDERSAEPSGIFVIRPQGEQSDRLATVYQLDVSNAIAFSMGSRFPLEPQDVIYVTTAPLARWNRVISLLLPSISLPGTTADTVDNVSDANN